MIVKLLTEHHIEFLSLKWGCRGSSESTLVKISNCWKFYATAQYYKESLDKTCHIKQGFHCVYVYANVLSSEWAKDMLISLPSLATNNKNMLFVDSTHVCPFFKLLI